MSRPIRDPEELEMRTHAYDMAKSRNIGAFEIKKAISEGDAEVGGGATEDFDMYRLEFPGPDLIVIVKVPVKKIWTVYYDNEQGAQGGGI